MSNSQGRLSSTTVYLAGPIDRVSREEAREWREKITGWLVSRGVKVIDPIKQNSLNGFDEIEVKSKIDALKAEGRFSEIRPAFWRLRAYDLRYVDKSDFVIFYGGW